MTEEQCIICAEKTGLECHHIHPRHLGGHENSRQIWLCGTHHAAIHKVAERIYKGKPIEPEDDGPWLQTLAAKAIIERLVFYRNRAEHTDLSHVESRIMLKLPKGKLKRIHQRKLDMGFSSLEKYLMALIDRDLP